jgi:hypothetical protein
MADPKEVERIEKKVEESIKPVQGTDELTDADVEKVAGAGMPGCGPGDPLSHAHGPDIY